MPNSQSDSELKKEALESGLKEVLEGANIPMRHHLAVIKILHDKLKEHKADRETHLSTIYELAKQLKTSHDRLDQYDTEVQRLHSLPHIKGERGNDGFPGADGRHGRHGRDGKDGLPGRDGAPGAPGADGKHAEVDLEMLVNLIVTKIQTEKVLDISHIKNAQTFMKNGIRYKVEELMRGAGGISTNSVMLPLTGAINASNTTFTFARIPVLVVVNGGQYRTGAGVTITGTTVVLDSPAGVGGDVYALG